ncbi:MAG: helical backbone metal receptor [Myxococcales bacterium]|nr:helical backbone metal receptor [Myxococcales bacterium]
MSASPQRIVSLVPSLTEALFVLGLGARVVGVTDWCVHPAAAVAGLPKVGGTKTPDLAAIRALAPDLVIANHEENRRTDVEQLEQAGLRVWVTYPRTVREGAELLAELADLGAAADRVRAFVTPVLEAVQRAEEAPVAVPVRVFCPIWRDPWMVPGPDTYVHDLIRLCGGSNPFPNLEARRYPRLELDAVVEAAPEVILLPDEPYAFGPRDAAELATLPVPAAVQGRIHLIDGTLVSWYGPRIREAVEKLRGFFAT